jgi:signal transduction histidine kinase
MVRLLYVSAIVVVVPLLAWNALVQQINDGASDLLLRLRGPAGGNAVENITLLAIDDATARRYGPLPLDRSRLAEGIEKLARLEPRTLVVDLLLSEPHGPEQDQALASALRTAPRPILAAALENSPAADHKWIEPLPFFRDLAVIGHVHAAPDPDGITRSVLLVKTGEGKRYWALGLQAARLSLGAKPALERPGSVELGAVRIPTPEDAGRLMRINFAGPEGAFRRVSFASLLEDAGRAEDFRDKIVFLGVTAQGSGDRLFTPLSSGIGMSGIEIHANVTRTILDAAFLVPLRPATETAVYAALAAACFLAARRLRGPRLVLALVAGAALFPVAGFAALSRGSVWPLGSLLAVFLFASGTAGAAEYALVASALRAAEQKRREYAFRVQSIAHELGAPLTAIQGSSELIADASIPESKRLEMAGLIHKESRRLTSTIRTFLDVERLAASGLQLEKRPVDLPSLCAEVLERARLYAARKQIRIEGDLRPATLDADPDLLSFAVYNLLTNAVKYSPKGASVWLALIEDSRTLSISVGDQGYGITPEEQGRIFERFYRLQRDRNGAEQGAGIGLALVKEIVEQHGGRILVESRPGAGSRFTLVLPKTPA